MSEPGESSRNSLPPELLVRVQIARQAYEEYDRTGQISALDQEVAAWEDILQSPAFQGTEPGFRLVVIVWAGEALLSRYQAQGRPEDLDRVLILTQQAVDLTLPGSPSGARHLGRLSNRLADLASMLFDRYGRSRDLADLDAAIRVSQQRVNLTPDEHPYRASMLSDLGILLSDRYQRSGDLADLEAAIQATQQAVDLAPEGSQDIVMYLYGLGSMLFARYGRSFDLADLDAAIRADQQAFDLTPSGSPEIVARLVNLGGKLSDRYQRSGDLADLEAAIQAAQQAVDLTSNEDPHKAGMLHNLGTSLFNRYRRFGDLADLDASIRADQQALDLTPSGSPEEAARLNNLGSGLSHRYHRTGELDDLDAAIRATQQAVDLTAEGSPDKAGYLTNLANLLNDRFVYFGDLVDLDAAIQVAEQAVDLTPNENPIKALTLFNLSNQLANRYDRSFDLADLEAAIRATQQAVDLSPDGSPGKTHYLSNLGRVMATRYRHSDDLADLEAGRAAYRKALELGQIADPEAVIRASSHWGNWALIRSSWEEAVQAFQPGLETIDTLVHQHASRASKEAWLKEAQGIPGRYAYALARSGKPEQALVAIETGRARLLSEQLSLEDIDLQALMEPAPELASRYRALTQQAAQWRTVDLQQTQDVERVRTELRQVNEELAQLAEQIRQVEGFAHFLCPVEVADIYQAARDHPLAYIAATTAGGMALLAPPGGDVEILRFDELTQEQLLEQIQSPMDKPGDYLGAYWAWTQSLQPDVSRSEKKQAFDGWLDALDVTTGWLWDTLMGKLVNWLSDKGQSQCALVPTGLLTLLPLHAAWTEDDTTPTGRHFALDEILFTYAPNAQALLSAQEKAQRPADSILAVDNPDRTLRFSEKEVQAVLEHFAEQAHLQHQEATFDAIAREMADANVLHFATHGLAHFQQPLESLLVTADQPLKLRDILPLDLDQARLAVLSACETGLPGTRNIDEVIALPTGLLQAGVPGVIGSMWLVADVSTMMLMERFYSLWKDDGFDPPEALRKAQQWLRDTTNEEKQKHYQEWIIESTLSNRMPADFAQAALNEILMKNPDERSFAHPFFWAAFGYYGA